MTDHCTIALDGAERRITVDDDGHAWVPGIDCPSCAAPLRVVGAGASVGGWDYYRADGRCAHCSAPIGEIRAYVSTIFGLDEDALVAAEVEPRGGRVYV